MSEESMTDQSEKPTLNIAYAHSLQWANKEQTRITAIVEWHQMPGEMQFTGSDDDVELHSVRFMERARNGDFGPIADHVPEVPVVFTPVSISPLQARKGLRASGLKPMVDAYISTLPEEYQEEWEYATEIRRDSPIIAAGIALLPEPLTEEQVDELFRQWSQL